MTTKTLAIILSILMLGFVIELVRRERLTFKYAAGWIACLVLAIFFSIFDQWLYTMAKYLGFELTSNFIFFALLCAFVFLSLLLTIFLCQQDNHNTTTAQRIGILQEELDRFKDHTH